jgi:hypothetical protein
MSTFVQRLKDTFSMEQRLKKKALRALDIADRIIVETQARQLNLNRCAQYQKEMLENLHEIMDGALKIGNRPLYIQSGKLAEVVGEWHKITTEMSEDQKLMIQFMAMTKTFYRGVIEYRDVVQDFSRTIRDFNSLKKFGLSIPRQIQTSSAEAARSFQELVNSIASIDVGYTRLTDYVLLKDKDEERLSKQFEEGRRRLSEKQ